MCGLQAPSLRVSFTLNREHEETAKAKEKQNSTSSAVAAVTVHQ